MANTACRCGEKYRIMRVPSGIMYFSMHKIPHRPPLGTVQESRLPAAKSRSLGPRNHQRDKKIRKGHRRRGHEQQNHRDDPHDRRIDAEVVRDAAAYAQEALIGKASAERATRARCGEPRELPPLRRPQQIGAGGNQGTRPHDAPYHAEQGPHARPDMVGNNIARQAEQPERDQNDAENHRDTRAARGLSIICHYAPPKSTD